MLGTADPGLLGGCYLCGGFRTVFQVTVEELDGQPIPRKTYGSPQEWHLCGICAASGRLKHSRT